MLNQGSYKKLFSGIILSALPSLSFAIDMDFYTYGGFSEMLQAFTRVALVFNDGLYESMIFVAVMMGLFFGGSISYARSLLTQQSGPVFGLGWLVTTFFGFAIYAGLVLPKGTLHLYDPVQNRYEAIDEVPDIIVATAGFLNHVERTLIQIVDNGSAYPYGRDAGGERFNLLYHIPKTIHTMNDEYMNKSLRRYYKDCGEVALSSDEFDVDENELKHTSTDLFDTFEKFASDGNPTIVYSEGNKAGETMSCTEAWETISTEINDVEYFNQWKEQACAQSGYDVSNAAVLGRCEDNMDTLGLSAFNVNLSHINLLRTLYLAEMVQEAIYDIDPDLKLIKYANRSAMNEGFAISLVANQWLPTIRSTTYALILGCLPLVLLLVVTPLLTKALWTYFGLFLFMTIWGFTDAMIHRAAMDQAITVINHLQRHNIGMESIMMMPDAAQKALAVFGKARSIGVMLAASLSALLFKFSSYSFSNISSRFAENNDRQAEMAAQKTQTPEGMGETTSALRSAVAESGGVAAMGFRDMALAGMTQQNINMQEHNALNKNASEQGTDLLNASDQIANIRAGATIGRTDETTQITEHLGGDATSIGDIRNTSATIAGEEFKQSAGATLGTKNGYEQMGSNSLDGSILRSSMDSKQDYARNLQMVDMIDYMNNQRTNSGGSALSVEDSYKEIAGFELARMRGEIGASGGDAANLEHYTQSSSTQSLSSMQGLLQEISNSDYSLEQVSSVSGQIDALRAIGKNDAINELNPDLLSLSERYNMISETARAEAITNNSANYGGAEAVLEAKAYTDTATDIAHTMQKINQADILDTDIVSSEMATAGAHRSAALTEQQTENLASKGVINESASGSGVGHFSIDEHGAVATSTHTSGQSSTENNSVTIDDSYNINMGSNYTGQQTTRALIYEEDTQKLADELERVHKNEGDLITFTDTLGYQLSAMISSQEVKSDEWGLGGGINIGLGSKNGSSPISAGVGGNGNISTSAKDQDSYNSQFYIAEKALEESREEAEKDMRSRGISTDSDEYNDSYYHSYAENLQNIASKIDHLDKEQLKDVTWNSDRVNSLFNEINRPPTRGERKHGR